LKFSGSTLTTKILPDQQFGSVSGGGGGGGGGSSFDQITSGINTTATMTVGPGATLFPNGTGQIGATWFTPSALAQPVPGAVDYTGCSSQSPVLNPFGYAPLSNGHFAEWMCMDESVVSPPQSPAGTPEFTYRTWWNATKVPMPGMKNRLVGIAWFP